LNDGVAPPESGPARVETLERVLSPADATSINGIAAVAHADDVVPAMAVPRTTPSPFAKVGKTLGTGVDGPNGRQPRIIPRTWRDFRTDGTRAEPEGTHSR